MPSQTAVKETAQSRSQVVDANLVNGPLPDERWTVDEEDRRETPAAVDWCYWEDRDGAWMLECRLLGLNAVIARPDEVVDAVLQAQESFWHTFDSAAGAHSSPDRSAFSMFRGLPWRLELLESPPHSTSRGSGRERLGLLSTGQATQAGPDPSPLGALDDWEI